MMAAPGTPGGRRPQTSKGGNRGTLGQCGASDAMGILKLAVCCRRVLTGCLGSGRRGGEPGWLIAIGRTGVAQRRLIDTALCCASRRSMARPSLAALKQRSWAPDS
jgi:hypothetical protein